MSYKFIKTLDESNNFDKTNVTIELPHNEQCLDDLLEAFQDFLKACGFAIDKIEAVKDEQ
jgi:hypothetical protein